MILNFIRKLFNNEQYGIKDQEKVEYPDKPIFDDNMRFKNGVVEALTNFKNKNTTIKSPIPRFVEMVNLVKELSNIYNIIPPSMILKIGDIGLYFDNNTGYISVIKLNNYLLKIKTSCYYPDKHFIYLMNLSIITLLHEFYHSRGMFDEYKTVRYSISLFKRVYPNEYKKLKSIKHVLVRK